jgi:hypothetical protein
MGTTVDLVRDRKSGTVKITTIKPYDAIMPELLETFGLESDSEAFEEISSTEATLCLAVLLWKDLAYGVTCMPKERAEEHASAFMAEYFCDGARCFTNGRWDTYLEESSFPFASVTSATFNAVILLLSASVATCFLIEDED